MPQVKICGNTNIHDARLAVELGADYLGFIFAASKRKISLEIANDIRMALPSFHEFVGVFANQPKNEVEAIAKPLGLKWLQFHGEETALYCQWFRDKGYKVIKTFRIKDPMSLKRLEEYNVEAFLFDTFSKESHGGTGTSFNWDWIEDKPYVHEKLFLAGGLNVLNLKLAIDKLHPYAVDVASGVESTPGKKDTQLLKQFMTIAKSHEKK